MKIRLLGTGTSTGVPRIGNDWGACDPWEPRNRRTRASALVSTEITRILVDTGPDMRSQLNDADVGHVDAVIWTHDHADHTNGIDDLRQLAQRNGGTPVRCLARASTAESLEERFAYVFKGRGGYPPTAKLELLPDRMTIGDIAVHVADQPHGRITSAGLRFEADGGSIGYATDFSDLTNDLRALYKDLDFWAVDALREAPHPSHPHLAAVLGWIEALAPRRAALIHMDNSMDYATLSARLPQGVEPGYDGLEVTV